MIPDLFQEKRRNLHDLHAEIADRLHQLSVIELLDRQWDSAQKSIEKILDMRPDHAGARANQEYLKQQLRHQEAIAGAETVFAAGLLMDAGQPDRAASLLSDFLTRFPAHEGARDLAGRLRLEYQACDMDAEAAEGERAPVEYALDSTGSVQTEKSTAKNGAALFGKDWPAPSGLPDQSDMPEINEDVLMRLLEDARQLAENGLLDAARLSLQKILQLRDDFALAHNDMGTICHSAGEMDLARQHYERAVAEAPDSPVFRKNLADFLLMEAEDPEAAMFHYHQALMQNPNDTEAMLGIGEICLLSGDVDSAAEFYHGILRVEPGHEGARQRLQQISDLSDSSDPVRSEKSAADTGLSADKRSSVENDGTDHFTDNNDDGVEIREEQGRIVIRFADDGPDADPLASEKEPDSLSSDNQPPETEDNPEDSSGPETADSTGEEEDPPTETVQDKIRELQELVNFVPENAEAHHELGIYLHSVAEKEHALEHLEAAVQYAPERPDFLKSLADFYYTETGRLTDALDMYERALAESPEDKEVLTILGNLYLNMEELSDARFYYEKLLSLMPDDPKIVQIVDALRAKTS